jgi:type IV pilus assembly protein PilQ
MKTIVHILFLLLFSYTISWGQGSYEEAEKQLKELSTLQPGLNEKVQVSVAGITLSDFISAIALEHNLNVSVDDELDNMVVNNFYDALVKDVFLFLIKKYDLNCEVTGSIIAFKKKPEEQPEPVVYVPKPIKVSYKSDNQFLSLDLKKDSLYRVAEAITKESGKNVVLAPDVRDKLVSVYIENRPFEQVMDMMAKANGLVSSLDENGFYFLEAAAKPTKGNTTKNGKNRNGKNGKGGGELFIRLSESEDDKISVEAYDVAISEIIEGAASELGEHYFMYDVPEGNTNLKVENVDFMELLAHIMNGTDFTFKKMDNYYLIGNRITEGLRATELIQLENRSIETVKDLIPQELVKDIEIKEFVELNGLIVSGSYLKIEELRVFLQSVDQVVPMVQIDIIIVFSQKSSQLETGIKTGVSDQPVATQGDIFPGLDLTMGAESINGLISAFNGFGIINIGAVTPNFYASLKLLESNSVIDIKSTPKISTLNGHEATFSVGETSYYQQENVSIQPNISGGSVLSNRTWLPTQANLDITVKPYVSADESVTLQIKVNQDDFNGKVDPAAPPNKTTQTFESLIRVKNGETILMGGLDKDSDEDSGTGTPVLSRIPILKWFFSSRDKDKEKSKLHIFIKPTITY